MLSGRDTVLDWLVGPETEGFEPAEDAPIVAGRSEIQSVPLLAGHRGTQPDLVLRWNAMPARPGAVDVVVHLHGYSSRAAGMQLPRDKEPVSGLDFGNPDTPTDQAAGRSRPTLGVLPRGNFFGGRRGSSYDFPALVRATGVTELVAFSLAQFGAIAGVPPPQRARLILTAHSGGGAALRKILRHEDPDEIHVFDALYGAAETLVAWAERRIAQDARAITGLSGTAVDTYRRERGGALRVFYRPGTDTEPYSQSVGRAVSSALRGVASGAALAPSYRVEQTTTNHHDVARRYGWRLLADASANVPGAGSPASGRAAGGEAEFHFGLPSGVIELARRRTWMLDAEQSAIAEIRDEATRRHFLTGVNWAVEHFPAPGETNEAERLFGEMARLVPERRVTRLPYHNVERVVVAVQGEGGHRLHPEAAAAYVRIRQAAAEDGVTMRIGSSFRSEAEQQRIRSRNPNPNAVAQRTSAHTYGLAVDLHLSVPNLRIVEATTRPMTNVIAMYRSPVYKWMYTNGAAFGWFPYKREPWHWEYNPPGFAERFAAEARARAESAEPEDEGLFERVAALVREFLTEAAAAADRYGGYALKRGDGDGQSRWAGAARSRAAGDTMPAPGGTGFVTQLQRDLRELGFTLVGPDNGVFGRPVEWAVREFQIYAKMNNVAQEVPAAPTAPARYVDRLSGVANTQRYTGAVSGVVNRDTRAAIAHWLANRWRCPVVVEAWNMAAGARTTLHTANIWLHNEVTSSAPRMFARDFSGYYALPAGRHRADLITLGDHASYLSWDGPRSAPPSHTWPEAELLPEHLAGTALAGMSAAQRSTYKVVRAVSEVECIGFFDSVNAYDNAFVSLGPCHWTLGIVNGGVSEGELCGYLSFLRQADPAAFGRAIEFFGVRIDEDWTDAGVANGRRLFNAGSRKYTGWVALQQEGGGFVRMPLTEADGNYFKTWHWFYRFLMAGRTIEGFRRRMWHMARVRIRDIRSTPWGAGVAAVPLAAGGTRPATIGDVYTSERAMALILRWHIRFPAHICHGGHAGARLRAAFARAGIGAGAGDPTTWTDAHEADLIRGLREEVAATNNAAFIGTIGYVDDWPRWATGPNPRGYALDRGIGRLAVTRASLQFDGAALPPAP